MEQAKNRPNASFNFAWITSERRYNIEGLRAKKKSGQEQKELFELLDHLQIWSSATMNQLKSRGKREDGFELMKISEFSHPVFDHFPVRLDEQTPVAVFRFSDYRLAALFQTEQTAAFMEPDIFYVAAFDWDYTLYDHGA